VLSGEATNTNFIVFGLTRPRIEPTIYWTRGEDANHYTTDTLNHNSISELLLTVALKTNKTDHHGITELLLKVVLNTNKTDHHSNTELLLTVALNTNKTDHHSITELLTVA
jgi:hypothetical protein